MYDFEKGDREVQNSIFVPCSTKRSPQKHENPFAQQIWCPTLLKRHQCRTNLNFRCHKLGMGSMFYLEYIPMRLAL
ncbi:hypothetical protein TNCV_3795811 [Trichonephila clavipes]|nr:hypothetical protein TNCV_3795811 [Trichonephila clavipes]